MFNVGNSRPARAKATHTNKPSIALNSIEIDTRVSGKRMSGNRRYWQSTGSALLEDQSVIAP